MRKVGITGSNGFVGKHLQNHFNITQSVEIVHFERSFFDNEDALNKFVKECDTIIHLAALCRHPEPQAIYDVNIELNKKIINACKRTNTQPHIFFSSSIHEDRDTVYGRSKKDGNALFSEWAEQNNGKYTALIFPNIFGPFSKPFYNSVAATFCHQIGTGQQPKIIEDGLLQLAYINDVVEEVEQLIIEETAGEINIKAEYPLKVSELLEKLSHIRNSYLIKGEIPCLESPLELALFNTLLCYVPKDHFPVGFVKHTDDRGSFVEIVRADTSGQFSFSTTKPGITRGNHYHTRKAERFSVIKGKARIQIRKVDTDEVVDYFVDGDNPAYVDIPIWHVHNITNVGDTELVTLFWINEPYDQESPDTYFVEV